MNINEVKEIVTPELAKQLLEVNTLNRALSEPTVVKYAKILESGRWMLNGDTIRISSANVLLDGQHRLAACVRTGVAFECVILENIPPESFTTIDVGKKRSGADTLSVLGYVSCRNLNGALVQVAKYDMGKVGVSMAFSNPEILEFAAKYPGVPKSVKACERLKKMVPLSILAACHYLFSRESSYEADAFIDNLDYKKATDLSFNDPMHLLKRRLIDNMGSNSKLDKRVQMALIIKTWNYRREGKQINQLKFTNDGKFSEAFPEVK